jgi:tyrosyl-tRNA synthetase
VLQKTLAKDITIRVHSEEEYNAALEASDILFGKGTNETLRNLSEETLLSVFEGVPQCEIALSDLRNGIGIIDFLSHKTGIFISNSEARRMLKEGGVQLNKQKAAEELYLNESFLLNGKYLLVQKGRKNYYLVITK